MKLNISELSGFPRSIRTKFPHPKKVGEMITFDLKVRFNHLDAEEHAEWFALDNMHKLKHTQEEICNAILEWVDPEDLTGVESSEQAKTAVSKNIAFQNSIIDDFGECQSGFSRKNLRG